MNVVIGDFDIVNSMIRHGGSFVRALGLACLRADDDNLRRVREAFPELWIEYAELARIEIEKRR
jgi:hypothetical protein